MNILIIGLGSIARKHIQALKLVISGARIYALRSAEAGDSVEGVENIFNLEDIPGKPAFVIISSPTYLHLESIRKCMQLEIPMMIEKPLLHELQPALDFEPELAEKNIITYVACNLRFHPAITFLKSFITEHIPKINEVNVYCGSYLPDWRPGKDFRTLYSANPEMGGGVHIDLIHEIDYVYWLWGKPHKTIGIERNKSTLQIKATDFAAYHLLYEQFTANITLNYYRRDTKRTIEIVFDNETWKADLIKCEIISNTGQVIFSNPQYRMIDTYIDQIKYFIQCIDGNRKPMNSYHEALEVLTIALQYGKTQ